VRGVRLLGACLGGLLLLTLLMGSCTKDRKFIDVVAGAGGAADNVNDLTAGAPQGDAPSGGTSGGGSSHCAPSEKECASGCVASDGCCTDAECATGQTCTEGVCSQCAADCPAPSRGSGQGICQGSACTIRCAEGLSLCGDACVSLTQDGENCGACDKPCEGGLVCQGGKCGSTCNAGLEACGASCADLKTDVNHCGDCTSVCSGPSAGGAATCQDGKCDVKCDGTLKLCEGKCLDTDTDLANCGGCGKACAGTCVDGLCCPQGQTNCGGSCVSLDSSATNCGMCDKTCASGEVCSKGACAKNCGAQTLCGSSCVDLATDIGHCGSCPKTCSPPPSNGSAACQGSQCKIVCAANYAECTAGSCTNLKTDLANCGGCDKPCAGVCSDGVCCSAGQTTCSGKCVNLETDAKNCNACGHVCAAGQVCEGGSCLPDCGSLSRCGQQCVDLTNDENNCKTCGKKCPLPSSGNGDAVCQNSACKIACDANFAECTSGTCTNTKTSSTDCGACNKPCGGTCQSGLCCAAGQSNCSGACKNLQADALNCLTCGNICSGSQVCTAGSCTLAGTTDKSHFVAAAHCPAGEVLKGLETTSATRIMCEPSNEWDPTKSAETTVAPVNNFASCPAKSVAVGWVQATKSLVCRPFRRAVTDSTPLAADTNDIAALGMPCHQNDYFQWFNGTFTDEMPMCKTRNDAHGILIELGNKVIKNEQGQDVNYGFTTCGL
jgi:hypothetical protein